ncbi:MAG: pantetheine-phosphate adenylyltransferase [Candidatus Dormibacteria bacterium]
MKIAVYPGSFDPITLGHVDVVQRASSIFDRVVVAVSVNPHKSPLFTPEERMEMIRESLDGTPGVEVATFTGLTVEYARQIGANSIVKGLRATSDFESEFQQALFNRKLAPEITTMFLMTSFANVYLSSSLVKEVARFGGDISFAVTPGVASRLVARYRELGQDA